MLTLSSSRPLFHPIPIEIFTDWEGRWLRTDCGVSFRYPALSEFPSSLFRYSFPDGVHLPQLSLARSLLVLAMTYHRSPFLFAHLKESDL